MKCSNRCSCAHFVSVSIVFYHLCFGLLYNYWCKSVRQWRWRCGPYSIDNFPTCYLLSAQHPSVAKLFHCWCGSKRERSNDQMHLHSAFLVGGQHQHHAVLWSEPLCYTLLILSELACVDAQHFSNFLLQPCCIHPHAHFSINVAITA